MAFRTRRRRPQVVWLPPAPENRIAANPAIAGYNPGGFTLELDFAPGTTPVGTEVVGYTPLISDIPSAQFQASGLALESLADIQGSAYRLRRIVGKLYCGYEQSTDVGAVPAVLVTAGIIVLRVDPSGQPIQASAPENYSPARINQWADPWVWRRTWILSNFNLIVGTGYNAWPETNAGYGSVADGPHIDQKTARIVSLEERLFLVVSMLALISGNPAGATDSALHVWGDLRFVGSLKRMAGNRRNASR